MLPCSGFHTDGRYANGRGFIDAGGALAIATNCNPGSAPTNSMPMAIALAARFNGVTPSEAITACTANAAALLGFSDRGFIAPGARADLVLLRHTDERALAFEFGGNPVEVVVCGGAIIASE
jgi:imidazolonepropionase